MMATHLKNGPPPGLRDLFERLDRYRGAIPLAALRSCLRRARISAADVREYAASDATCYRRARVRREAGHEVLVLVWRRGQRSPIHDHTGSACAFRVLSGVATETLFERSPCGLIVPTRTLTHRLGAVAGSSDRDMHQMGNLERVGADLVTLHVYSPPLLHTRSYFLGDSVIGEFNDLVEAAASLRRSVARQVRRRSQLVVAR